MRVIGLMAAALALFGAARAAPSDLLGAWRLTHGRPAPWWDASLSNPVQVGWIGRTLSFSETELNGFNPLECRNAHYEATSFSADMLFQGGFEGANPGAAAAGLGLVNGPFSGVSFSCDSGLFEFHSADADTMLFALDNVVWTMSRAYGATVSAATPEHAVEAFLEKHFAGDMGFTQDGVAQKSALFSKSLRARIAAYWRREFPEDVVPPVDGDPFTDSQEYPTRFAVRKGKTKAGRSATPVDFADGYQTKHIVYRLKRENGAWRIDDLVYEGGDAFSAILRMNVE